MPHPNSPPALSPDPLARLPDPFNAVVVARWALRIQLWQDLTELYRFVRTLQRDPASLDKAIEPLWSALMEYEHYWAFPGAETIDRLSRYRDSGQHARFFQLAHQVTRSLTSGVYKQQPFSPFYTNLARLDVPRWEQVPYGAGKNYFEVLVVHPDPKGFENLYREGLGYFKSDRDEYLYDILMVSSVDEAEQVVLCNSDIQACVYVSEWGWQEGDSEPNAVLELRLRLSRVRSELNHYMLSHVAPAQLSLDYQKLFDRVLFHIDPFHELHQSLLNGVRKRFLTPFFHALLGYSKKTVSAFHALPLAQGCSVANSPWIQDFYQFYGDNIFNSETSSTQGGLDSLLDPKGAIKQAHDCAAQTFGAEHAFFVTNGTSTSNKIVMQANLNQGDIVLISSDCHKSIAYSAMLCGASPIFLEAYPLQDLDLYGAVPLTRIKAVLLDLQKQGQLHRVRQITLTNSTFDGLIYNVQRYMLDILAIKPDIIFHWDEAWYGFAHFHWLYRVRSAMQVAEALGQYLASDAYALWYQQWHEQHGDVAQDLSVLDKTAEQQHDILSQPWYPQPSSVRLRVYATQSTHKTLTAFRQGSMILARDPWFRQDLFLDAYRMHSSTSPNYQILASLDIGRRQMDLEGYYLVNRSIHLANALRQTLRNDPDLSCYFKALDDSDLIPAQWRGECQNNADQQIQGNPPQTVAEPWNNAWMAVDPTRITLDIKKTGMDGPSFRQLLISEYAIQVNKTSASTVLFIINIGTDQGAIDYLLQVLREIADRLNQACMQQPQQMLDHTSRKKSATLPMQRHFHSDYCQVQGNNYQAVDIRAAYYAARREDSIEYVPLDQTTIDQLANGAMLVSAAFVTPYPPGFPILVPGQLVSLDILRYLQSLKFKEIHGFEARLGLKVFRHSFLN